MSFGALFGTGLKGGLGNLTMMALIQVKEGIKPGLEEIYGRCGNVTEKMNTGRKLFELEIAG